MKKIKKISKDNIKKLVRDRFNGIQIKESSIDKAIREYLNERDEEIYSTPEVEEDGFTFTEKTNEALGDMAEGIEEMISDLDIITLKEGDILVDTDGEGYSEEYIRDYIITSLEDIVEELQFLKNLNGQEHLPNQERFETRP